MSNLNYHEAVEALVEGQRKDPEQRVEVFFLEGGCWFELTFVPEDEETRQFIEGYVKLSTMDTWLDTCEFASLDVNSMKEWVYETVWDFVCR